MTLFQANPGTEQLTFDPTCFNYGHALISSPKAAHALIYRKPTTVYMTGCTCPPFGIKDMQGSLSLFFALTLLFL